MRSFLGLFLVVAGAAHADDAAGVYVNEIIVTDPALTGDAAALTTALCGALAKDKRVDVLCGPDVRQLVAFAAAQSMLGAANPTLDGLQRRVDATRFVVSAKLVGGKGTTTLTATIGSKDDVSDLGAMSASTALVAVDETSSARATPLLDRMPGVARRLVDAALAPTSLAPTAAVPPEPLPTTLPTTTLPTTTLPTTTLPTTTLPTTTQTTPAPQKTTAPAPKTKP